MNFHFTGFVKTYYIFIKKLMVIFAQPYAVISADSMRKLLVKSERLFFYKTDWPNVRSLY